MEEIDVETVPATRCREKFPGVTPTIITDNGPQFIAKDFKEFIRVAGMTHVRTSPYYPQSNGKIERWHKTLKGDCIRVKVPLSLDDARNIVADFVTHYNEVRLHSAVGYVTPNDRLLGNDEAIHAERDRKLTELAREHRIAETASDTPRANRGSARIVTSRHRLRRRAGRHHHRPGADAARLHAALRPRRPATRHGALSAARLHSRHRPLASASNTNSARSTASSATAPATRLDLWATAKCARCRFTTPAIDLCQRTRLNVTLPTLALPPATARNREEETVATDSSTCTIP